MYNPYAPNPYIQQGQQQDIGGLAPVFQNMASQQANQNAALSQQNQLMNQASQVGSGGGGMNPLAMAIALRGGKPQGGTPQNGISNLGARLDMALNSKASPMLQDQVSKLGSSTANPFSDYNMGTGGFGNYGE
jgi:hypothetical protein